VAERASARRAVAGDQRCSSQQAGPPNDRKQRKTIDLLNLAERAGSIPPPVTAEIGIHVIGGERREVGT
jgi:hypothetical protein